MDKKIQDGNSDTQLDREKLLILTEEMLARANQLGASSAEVGVNSSAGLATTVRLGEVDTIEFHRSKSVDITVYFGLRKGSASSSDTRAEAIESTIKAACDIAKIAQEDPYVGLADKALMAFDYPDLKLYYPHDLSPTEAIELAQNCEQIARTEDKRIVNSEGASVATSSSYYVYGNSHGFIGHYPSTSYSMSCSVVAKDKDTLQRDYYYTVARDFHDLESASYVAKQAAQRTLSRLGARKIKTTKAPVIFNAETAKGLFGSFIAAIKGSNLYRRSSFLLDHLNQQIFPEFVHIYENPHLLKGNSSAPFDAEGVRTQQKDFIRAGILKNYVLSSYSARRLGLMTTGNAGGVYNLFVEPNPMTQEELIKKMGRGLLVTELMGQGVNILTGDYSRGAMGYWVEDGQIQYPVEEVTIAGHLSEMFLNIQAIANDVDRRGNIHTGSVLVNGMMIGGE